MKELLQQALDALEWASDLNQIAAGSCTIHDAITDLRSALAAPMPEPSDMVMVPREPTQAMCAAAVVFANGNAVYKNVLSEVLKLEESIYAEVYEAMIAAAPAPAVQCPTCNGDDMQAPCAYPEGGQPGCLRDKRLSAAPVVPLTDERLQKHAMRAGDCPPGSMVVLLSSLRRMLSAAPVVRDPLTDEQLEEIVAATGHGSALFDFARAIEQAHGIGGGK